MCFEMKRTHSITLNLFIYLKFFFNASQAYMMFHTFSKSPPTYFTTTFTPHVIAKTCLLKPERGPCRADIVMYYFDPSTKSCSTFSWGGCQGNGNRFDTEEECLFSCVSNEGDKSKAPKYCSLTFDYGYCFGSEPRWYFDRQYKVCKQTLYSGCGGNRNNFYNEERCDDICRFGHTIFATSSTKRITDNIKRILVVNPYDTTTVRTSYYTTRSKRTTCTDETSEGSKATDGGKGTDGANKYDGNEDRKEAKSALITQPDSPDKERQLLGQMLPFHVPIKLYNAGTREKQFTVQIFLTKRRHNKLLTQS